MPSLSRRGPVIDHIFSRHLFSPPPLNHSTKSENDVSSHQFSQPPLNHSTKSENDVSSPELPLPMNGRKLKRARSMLVLLPEEPLDTDLVSTFMPGFHMAAPVSRQTSLVEVQSTRQAKDLWRAAKVSLDATDAFRASAEEAASRRQEVWQIAMLVASVVVTGVITSASLQFILRRDSGGANTTTFCMFVFCVLKECPRIHRHLTNPRVPRFWHLLIAGANFFAVSLGNMAPQPVVDCLPLHSSTSRRISSHPRRYSKAAPPSTPCISSSSRPTWSCKSLLPCCCSGAPTPPRRSSRTTNESNQ